MSLRGEGTLDCPSGELNGTGVKQLVKHFQKVIWGLKSNFLQGGKSDSTISELIGDRVAY